jgi:transcriptional regulator with GAF, ATPase, and Fis domain
LDAGASAVLAWDALDDPAGSVAAQLARWSEIEERIASPSVSGQLVGQSRPWKETLRQVVELALHTDVPVLVTGETGTGKELVARMIHELDPRRAKRHLVLVDCTTVAPELAGSEFFGHERGAFTHAVASRDGAFALADGGTLFLDEVGELPLRLQAELLRVVQEGTFKRVGSNEWKSTSFRLICATNRDLVRERAGGAFRDDLYHRLACAVCRLPTLDERRADIPLLVDHFLRALFDDRPPRVDPALQDWLMTRSYRGNLRELRQLVARLACGHVRPGPLSVGSIPPDQRPSERVEALRSDEHLELAVRTALAQGKSVEAIRNSVAQMAYRVALAEANGDTSSAAERLGVSIRAVQMYRKSCCDPPSSHADR